MSEEALRPGNVAAAAVLVGGVLIVAFPRYAPTIVQVVIVAAAVAGALWVLASRVPPTGWLSPFKWLSPFGETTGGDGPRHRSRELELIRSKLSGRRQEVADGPPMPPAVLRQLKPLIAGMLDVDPRDGEEVASIRDRISPLAYALLTSEPLERPSWLATVRPDPEGAARTVHRVLDGLEGATPGGGYLERHVDSKHRSTT